MPIVAQEPIEIELDAGDVLAGNHRTALWRLQSGALRMHDTDPAGMQSLIACTAGRPDRRGMPGGRVAQHPLQA
jgi:hypothetical protein